MGRGLDGFIFGTRSLAGCAVLKARGPDKFPVAIAWGKHLFPFRTEKLSPTAPMVLGPHGPGRVGRRRFLACTSRPPGGSFALWVLPLSGPTAAPTSCAFRRCPTRPRRLGLR